MKHRISISNSNLIRIIAGLVITSFGYHVFLNPHGISVGGITGACVLLNEYLDLPYTATLILLNSLLFVWGIKSKGLAYVVRSFVAMISLGFLLDMPSQAAAVTPASDVAAMIWGSVLTGVGYGLIVSADTSTGGSDLFAMLVVKRTPGVTVGMVMNSVDFLVVLAGGILEGMQSFLFSIAAMLLCNTFIDVTAYCFGSCELPMWLQRLKPKGQAVLEILTQTRVVVNPYAVCLAACVFFIVTRCLFASSFATAVFAV